MKDKKIDVLKIVEQNQQNIYDQKNEKNKPTEALISNRKKDIKGELIHKKYIPYKTGQDQKRGTKTEKADFMTPQI